MTLPCCSPLVAPRPARPDGAASVPRLPPLRPAKRLHLALTLALTAVGLGRIARNRARLPCVASVGQDQGLGRPETPRQHERIRRDCGAKAGNPPLRLNSRKRSYEMENSNNSIFCSNFILRIIPRTAPIHLQLSACFRPRTAHFARKHRTFALCALLAPQPLFSRPYSPCTASLHNPYHCPPAALTGYPS